MFGSREVHSPGDTKRRAGQGDGTRFMTHLIPNEFGSRIAGRCAGTKAGSGSVITGGNCKT